MADTQERRIEESTDEMHATADQMEKQSEQVGEHIGDAKTEWQQAKASEQVPTAAGDWEDTEDEAGGEDPAGFDDPESLDLDDEDLENDDGLTEEDDE